MKKLIFFFAILGILFSSKLKAEDDATPYLVIISMDGCRWDYPLLAQMPTLDSIAKVGVSASVQPSFPTKTFPNHYALATGLYPAHSGIVANEFYNPEIDRTYRIRDRSAVEDSRFYRGEPFWVTAEKQGVKSASYFWVGSETVIQGIQPGIWKKYDSSTRPEHIVDSVITWLARPEAIRPHLVSFYFNEPDRVGHQYGPESEETRHKVEYLDSVLGVFCHKLSQLDIGAQVNVIITSDHGMATVSKDKAIFLNNYIHDDDLVYHLGSNPFFLIEPKPDKMKHVYQQLNNIEGLTVWHKNDVPERLRYNGNASIASLVVVADEGWSVYWDVPRLYGKGTHGYDNNNKTMHAIFYAYGPAFKSNYRHPLFPNVDVYALMMAIMHLEPAETDGQLERVQDMLR